MTAPPTPVRSIVHAQRENGSLADELAMGAQTAAQLGLVPFALIHAKWSPSVQIIKHLDDPQMSEAAKGVALVVVDVDVWKDAELEANGLNQRAVPTLFRLDGNGHAVPGASITGGAWDDNTPENMAPPLGAFFRKHGAGTEPSGARVRAGGDGGSAATSGSADPQPTSPVVGVLLLVVAAALIGVGIYLGTLRDKDTGADVDRDAIAENVRKAAAAAAASAAARRGAHSPSSK